VRAANAGHRFFDQDVEPGVYSMVGAAAVLGGVCRVTISLVAIMLELTGGMTYIVPFMIAVLVAKVVGDMLNDGIYDLYIVLRGYPFLQEELDVTFTERCCDIMETGLTKLDMSHCPRVADVRAMLHAFCFDGFPVVNDEHFVGYSKREQLDEMLEHLELHGRGQEMDVISLEDVLPYTDCTVMRMVPAASLAQVHKVFKQLGYKYVFLVGSAGKHTEDVLQGIISKKNFLRFLMSGRVGHMAEHPSSSIHGRAPQQHWHPRSALRHLRPRSPAWRAPISEAAEAAGASLMSNVTSDGERPSGATPGASSGRGSPWRSVV